MRTISRSMLGALLLSLLAVSSPDHFALAQGARNQVKLEPLRQAIEFPQGAEWINTRDPITMEQLKGKLVLLDFWTYCCINCMHVLPVLAQAEQAYAKDLVVVGVHTAKFSTERDTENIREAVLRNEIHHPVLNDSERILWTEYGVNTWPTLVLIDPKGNIVWSSSGEISFKDLDKVLKKAHSKFSGSLSGKPLQIQPEDRTDKKTPLRFPGKVLADPVGKRLFIADSNHNRIVVSDLDGKLLHIIGAGTVGRRDGKFEEAQFNHPQGMAIYKNHLYVADTENHLIRRVDLEGMDVHTVAGTGVQQTAAFPGLNENAKIPKKFVKKPKATDIGSPWDLLVAGSNLYIAMAGPHQIWRMSLDESALAPFAGNGREDIVDGVFLPSVPYGLDGSSFAQPSGLATDGTYLFVADSEGSSIRALPLAGAGAVTTILGTAHLSENRLFTNGDVDGAITEARLQHPLGVACFEKKLLVADTYNNKVKLIDPATNQVSTLVGSAISGDSDSPARLDEPAGVSVAGDKLYIADTNNHKIRVWDLRTSTLSTLVIQGLGAPGQRATPKPTLKIPADAQKAVQSAVKVPSNASSLDFNVELVLPKDWKLNQEAPLGYVALLKKTDGSKLGEGSTDTIKPPTPKFKISVPMTNDLLKGVATLNIGVTYYFCRADGKGECLAETVDFEIPIEVANGSPTGVSSNGPFLLKHNILAPIR